MVDPKTTALPLGYTPEKMRLHKTTAGEEGIEPPPPSLKPGILAVELFPRVLKCRCYERVGARTRNQRLKRPLLYHWATRPTNVFRKILSKRIELLFLPWKGSVLPLDEESSVSCPQCGGTSNFDLLSPFLHVNSFSINGGKVGAAGANGRRLTVFKGQRG